MQELIPLDFFLATRESPVRTKDDTWMRPLPLSRCASPVKNETSAGTPVTYGDYFSAIGGFLEKDHYRVVREALDEKMGPEAGIDSVRGIAVFLVKHGAFYHPARVVVATGSGDHTFVINVAVSKTGRDHISGEFKLLAGLSGEFIPAVIPRVYILDEISYRDDQHLPMFSGQWFEGFYEFHLTSHPPENMSNIIVWDQAKSAFFLTPKQAVSAYQQAASILTSAYNFFTFEQISAWHHAAGDFILKPVDATHVDLRLITVRGYAPLVDMAEPDPAALVEGLLLFFVNLTIRNRLDRQDGTGDLAWADDGALKGTIKGFFNGLETIVRKFDLPQAFPAEFKNYIQAHPPEALYDLFSAVVAKIPGTSPEHDFVLRRIGKHVALFRDLLGSK